MRKEHLFIAILIVLAGTLFTFGSRAGSALQSALRGVAPSSGSGAGGAAASGGVDLTASLSDLLRHDAAAVSGGASGGITAVVYSQYPLNLKDELTIAAGSADGVSKGDAALADGILAGVVTATRDHTAMVQTIFDSRFQAAVRIGSSGADALLKGGANPALTLISAKAPVAENDEVYAAAAGMPYGTPLGTLHNLHDAPDKVFREAFLAVPYNPGALQQVTIVPHG